MCCIRKGKFANFAKFRGVLVKDKMAVDAADAVYFVANPKAAPRSLTDPSPPTEERLRLVNEQRLKDGKTPLAPLAAVPDTYKHSVFVSPFHIVQESADYLDALSCVFGGALGMDTLIEEAEAHRRSKVQVTLAAWSPRGARAQAVTI